MPRVGWIYIKTQTPKIHTKQVLIRVQLLFKFWRKQIQNNNDKLLLTDLRERLHTLRFTQDTIGLLHHLYSSLLCRYLSRLCLGLRSCSNGGEISITGEDSTDGVIAVVVGWIWKNKTIVTERRAQNGGRLRSWWSGSEKMKGYVNRCSACCRSGKHRGLGCGGSGRIEGGWGERTQYWICLTLS